MEIKQLEDEPTELVVKIKNTKPGDCIRFKSASFGYAVKYGLFWLRLAHTPGNPAVSVANLKSGHEIHVGDDTLVVVHECLLELVRSVSRPPQKKKVKTN